MTPSAELAARFLGAHGDTEFCLGCLAEMLAIPRSELVEAVGRLIFTGQAKTTGAACANCQQPGVVVHGV